jgi:integrase/recombinase XerD
VEHPVAGAKPRKRPIDIPSPDDVRALMHACSRRASSGIRDRALIVALWATGMRISEALAVLPRDLNLDALTVVIQNGKGDKRRVVGMLPDAVNPIERWLDRRRTLGIGHQHPLFCTISRGSGGPSATKPGGRLSREHVARVLRRLARRVGILGRCHPHALRHAHTALLRSRGLDVYAIKVQLGHAHLNTTDQYLHRLGSHELPDKLRAIGSVLAPKAPRAELGELLSRLGERDIEQLVALLHRAAT